VKLRLGATAHYEHQDPIQESRVLRDSIVPAARATRNSALPARTLRDKVRWRVSLHIESGCGLALFVAVHKQDVVLVRPFALFLSVPCSHRCPLSGASSCTAITVVGYKGYEYRALDGTAPTDTSSGCQVEYMALPVGGWSLTEYNADAVAVTAAYHWGTIVVVYADGRGVFTARWGSPYAGSTHGSDRLDQSGNTYKPSVCQNRILLRRPCAAGGYGGSMTTLAEASSACTCQPGQYGPPGAAAAGFPGCLHASLCAAVHTTDRAGRESRVGCVCAALPPFPTLVTAFVSTSSYACVYMCPRGP